MRSASLYYGPVLACFIGLVPLSAPRAASSTWVERSDRNAAIVLELLGAFRPEIASYFGAERYDTAVLDLGPAYAKRFDAAARRALAKLAAARRTEDDSRVKLDLDILEDAIARMRRTNELEERLRVPYVGLPSHVFQGLQMLLDPRNGEARRRNALERLRRYAGLAPGSTPIAELARARIEERFAAKGLAWPYARQLRQDLANCERFIAGIAELFRASGIAGWEPAHVRLAGQLRGHCAWLKDTVLPRARTDPTLPRELYADRLNANGVDLSPEQAIALGSFGYAEIRDEMARLAARIARERNLPSADYRDVLRELKRAQVGPERIVAYYRERLKDIEDIIVRERIVSLPRREASIRLASEAESAAIPAPYLNPPRLIGNKGERGEFVLPLGNPNAKTSAPADDFTAEGAAWTLAAHEARPGHELQFSAMVEGGVSLARAAFAFNSANLEGWALYAESLVLPHLPPEGQLFSLQQRLLRAARAFLDPLVNLGRMTPEEAKAFLMREATLSEPFAQQEADRYAFDAPGQAVSYFYGYTRMRELRVKAEIALGARFEPLAFHDLVLAQGLMPPALLERAVLGQLSAGR